MAAAVGVLLAVAAAGAGARGFDQPDRVVVSTTGNHSERVQTVPITRRAGGAPRVAMSLSGERIGDLVSGDRLSASSEVEVTTDCQEPSVRCGGRSPYTYDPLIDSQLILAPRARATGGAGTLRLSSVHERRCTHRQHHCTLVFKDRSLDVGATPPSCAPNTCHVNLVLSAHNSHAEAGDKLIVGEDEPDGSLVQDKGRVNALRLRPEVPGPEPAGNVRSLSSESPVVDKVPVVQKLGDGKSVVFSQRLGNLRSHAQLSVSANLRTDISGLPYDRVLVNSRLILARRPGATRPNHLVKRVAELNGEIAEANGFNCTPATTPCRTRKVGVAHLTAAAVDGSGSPVPLFVNLVVGTTPAGGKAQAGDAVAVTGGRLVVVRYPPSRYG